MGAKSKIEWTDATWTPIRARRKDTGKVGVHCERVSQGCKNCYSATFNRRNLPMHGTGLDFIVPNRDLVEIFLDEEILMQPSLWKQPKNIFVCSQTDLFADFVPDEMIDKVFATMGATALRHKYQVLTKRAERMCSWVNSWVFPFMVRSAWLGVSVEDQATADERTDSLRRTRAVNRFISYEPALGPVKLNLDGISWVIAGGESGPHARPAHPDWFRSVRDQCVKAGIPFFFKQWGEWAPLHSADEADNFPRTTKMHESEDGFRWMRVGKKKAGRLLDGREWSQFPEDLAPPRDPRTDPREFERFRRGRFERHVIDREERGGDLGVLYTTPTISRRPWTRRTRRGDWLRWVSIQNWIRWASKATVVPPPKRWQDPKGERLGGRGEKL